MPLTANGNEFWVQPRRGYKEQWAKNANQITVHIACDWDAAGDVKQFLLGWTEWDSVSETLTRHLPYLSPFGTQLYADSVELLEHGLRKNLPDSDEDEDNWPLGDWCIYQVVFLRPSFAVISDEDLGLSYSNLESNRYVSVRWGYNGREKRKPGYVFETTPQDPGERALVIDEVGFIPDWSSCIFAQWHECPEFAFPAKAVTQTLAKVNNADFTLRGKTYPPETLLFRGVAQELEPYAMPSGDLAVSPIFKFEYRPNKAYNSPVPPTAPTLVDSYGWNGTRLNNGNYRRARVRSEAIGPLDPTEGIPPYGKVDFSLLFVPNSDG